MGTQSGFKERTKEAVKVPKRYQVIMHNDDYTPMDFVVYVLMLVFGKAEGDAIAIMMMVHKGGKAVVGVFSYDMAQSKVSKVTALARENEYPFRLTIEEA